MSEIKKKPGLFSAIKSREDALKIIKDGSYGFYFVAALQAGIGFFIMKSLILDGVLFAILAFFLHKFKSRIAAVLLFTLSSAGAVSTFMNRIGMSTGGGNNVILAIIMLIMSVRAIEATFKLHGRYSSDSADPSAA